MIILGIETSCDETAASVVENGQKILSNVLASSAGIHAKTGGIIPEVAAREQVKSILSVTSEALKEGCGWITGSGSGNEGGSWKNRNNSPTQLTARRTTHNLSPTPPIDAIAVTIGGPGLIGSLLVGVETAKTLAFVWNKPIIPVVHMLAHVYANWIGDGPLPKFPAVVLTVSGGHSDLILMENHGKFRWLGGTRDDTSGETFDKIARYLGLGFPGGPEIQKIASLGNPNKIPLPRPMLESQDFDFSFSGLKTAVIRETQNKSFNTYDIAASFQRAVCEVLIIKTVRAAQKFKAKSILLAGGVAANTELRKLLEEKSPVPTFIPPVNLCTDNGTFIASYAYFNYRPWPWQKITIEPDIHGAIGKYAKNQVKSF